MKLFYSFCFIFVCTGLFAQRKQVVLRTNVKTFKVTDSGDPNAQKSWTVAPDINPDIFYTVGEKVGFITDVDSIIVKVSAQHPIFDFIVIYNGTDTCYTRVQHEEIIDYLGILKKAKKYNPADQRMLPEFTYQDMNDPELVALRKKYNLDSIAGTLNEVGQMLNLMHSVHTLIAHDGEHENSEIKNADEMISACSDGSRGLNCRGLAITLNDCFLAMGFKSRFVTCMPKELEFDDCHVINMVYSNDLKKWIYLDPTHDAYVMDEKGTLLSIEEVRERLISGKTLILNPGANWNNSTSTTALGYLEYYMAKNLYRLECPVNSRYDYETRQPNKNVAYVELLPLDGINQNPQKKEKTSEETQSVMTFYITNNPSLFWKAP